MARVFFFIGHVHAGRWRKCLSTTCRLLYFKQYFICTVNLNLRSDIYLHKLPEKFIQFHSVLFLSIFSANIKISVKFSHSSFFIMHRRCCALFFLSLFALEILSVCILSFTDTSTKVGCYLKEITRSVYCYCH